MLLARLNFLETTKDNKVKQKLLDKADIEYKALELFEKYKTVNVTWGACVQAVKTDFVNDFEYKWSRKLKNT